MNLVSFQMTMATWGGLATVTAYRLAPYANRATVLLYEAISGTTVVGGTGLLAGGKLTMTVVGGAIERRNMNVPITTRNATVDDIWDAAQEVYHDAPELLEFVKTFLNK